MNTTLAYLRGRRAWLVENLAVWGSDTEADLKMAVAETVGSDTRIGFWRIPLGGQVQSVDFASLVDSRGNQLPVAIKRPAITVIPRERRSAFIKSVNGETGFTVARCDDQAAPVVVDLMIFEMGL